jgi:hypothetical protein
MDGSSRCCIASILWAGVCLSGCSSITVFADPGKYQFSSCEHLDGQRKNWSKKEEEGNPLRLTFRPTRFDRNCTTSYPTELTQPFDKGVNPELLR